MKPSGETGSRTAIATGRGDHLDGRSASGRRLNPLPSVLAAVLLGASLSLPHRYGGWKQPLSDEATLAVPDHARRARRDCVPPAGARLQEGGPRLTAPLAVAAQGLGPAADASVRVLCAALIGQRFLPRSDGSSVTFRVIVLGAVRRARRARRRRSRAGTRDDCRQPHAGRVAPPQRPSRSQLLFRTRARGLRQPDAAGGG